MADKVRETLGDLRGVERAALDTLDKSLVVSRRYALEPSAVLIGVIGSTLGTGAGCLVGLYLAPALLLVAPVVLGVLGMPIGILLARGRRMIGLEQKLRYEALERQGRREEAEAHLHQIKALPKSVPDHVRDAMWASYLAALPHQEPPVPVLLPHQRLPAPDASA